MLKEIVKRVIAFATIGALAPMITVPFVKWEISAVNLSQDTVLQKYSIEDLKATQAFILNAPYNGNGKVIDAYEDGRIDCFDMVMLRKMYSEQTQKTGSFYSLSSDMVHDNDAKYGTMIMSDEFYSKRVIVKADTSYDFSDFLPKEVINGPDNLYVLQFETVENAELCMNALRKDEHIEYVELDEYMSCGEIESEQANANSWGVSVIEADQYAEYLGNNYNSSVVVAVVDTGVASHDFLKGRLLDTGYDLVDNDPDPNDKHYHGTHVAGTVVDCTPKLNINIMPVRVLDEYGNGSNLNVGNGIRYATEHGADVINLSLGGEGCSKYIDDSIAYAVDNGVTVVVAAGNEGDNTVHYCPAHVENCIVVAACNSNNEKANFSNYGNSVDVIAPGVDIKSCIPGGSYKSLNGTSMATPHISAAAAMIKYAEPNITPFEIEQKIKDVSLDLGDKGKDVYFGYGLPKLSNLIKDNPNIKPSITISETELLMVVGDNKLLTAQTVPSGQTVSWKSSNEKVATVENGTVKVISAGTAKITASFTYNSRTYTAECKVTVIDNSDKIVMSGRCGDNAYYELDGNGLLTISGTGKMWNYIGSKLAGSPTAHGKSPFFENEDILKVVIEDGITGIGDCVFDSCTNMKEITMPDTITLIEGYEFRNCKSLEEITIPPNVKNIGGSYYNDFSEVFYGCSSLKAIYVDDDNQNFADDDGALTSADGTVLYYIPLGKHDYVMSDNLVTLSKGCAENHLEITELIIPKSVTYIGSDAFKGCSNLKDIQLNQGLETIGSYAFCKTGITTINIPSTVHVVWDCAFSSCFELETVTFDTYGTANLAIFSGAFSGSKIKSIILPERVSAIDHVVFPGCLNLEYVKVLGYNTMIASDSSSWGYGAHTMGPDTTVIYGYAGSTAEQYAAESGMTFVNIDENFKIPTNGNFENGLHWDFTNNTLTISGVGDLPNHPQFGAYSDDAFDYIAPWWVHRNSVNQIVIQKGINNIGSNSFAQFKNLEKITISDSVTRIGYYAFYECTSLINVTISNSVIKINNYAFGKCTDLTDITIPSSVTSIGDGAFLDCSNLKSITILNPNCEILGKESTICNGYDENYGYHFNGTIRGYSGSTAQTYAEKYNYTFVEID